MAMHIEPLDAPLGAEVTGIDLGQPMDDTTREALNRALADHTNRDRPPKAHADYDISEGRQLYRVIVEGDRPV